MIHRGPVQGSAAVPTKLLNDSRLSFRTVGIAVYLLAKPPDWRIDATALARVKSEGRSVILKALKELEEAGYLVRHRAQVERGRWASWSVLYESPEQAAECEAAQAGGKSPGRTEVQSPNAGPPNAGPPEFGTPASGNRTSFLSPEREKDLEREPPSPTAPVRGEVEAVAHPEAEALCRHLAAAVALHRDDPGSEPAVSTKWRKDMRLLLERGPLRRAKPEPLPPERVRAAIDFVFTRLAERGRDGFCWADQIRSPQALREHWDQLLDAGRRLRSSECQRRPTPLSETLATIAKVASEMTVAHGPVEREEGIVDAEIVA